MPITKIEHLQFMRGLPYPHIAGQCTNSESVIRLSVERVCMVSRMAKMNQ